MKIKVTNTYTNKVSIEEGKDLQEVKNEMLTFLETKAHWLAENEVEEDWENYYDSYDEAYNATYADILEQLISEIEYQIIEA